MQHFRYPIRMKATLAITSRGVITLPVKIRKALGIQANDLLIAETTADGLLLRPAVALPVELYSPAREQEFDREEADLATFLTFVQREQGPPAKRKKSGRRHSSGATAGE